MRICIINNAGYVVVQRRAAALARLGHDVHVVSLGRGEIEGCTVHEITPPPVLARSKARYLIALPELVWTIRRLDPDVLDFHGLSSYGIFSLLPFRKPTVVTVYGPDIYYHAKNYRSLRMAVRAVLDMADLIIGTTEAIETYAREHTGAEISDRFRIRHVGIPTKRILEREAERRAAIRDEFGVSDTTRVILHSRHIAALWRVPTLIEAFPRIVEAHPDVELWLAYPPPNRPGEKMLAAAQARVAEQGLKEKVRFLGYHPYDRLISIMHASDVYVCIGTHDLLCSSILESLCTGLVPVVSPIPAYHAVIKHGVNGFFVDPVTPENVAAQVNEVLADFEQLRPRVAAYNRELTVPRFDLDASAEWTAARYREAIERRRDTGGLTKLRAALARAGAPGFGRRLK